MATGVCRSRLEQLPRYVVSTAGMLKSQLFSKPYVEPKLHPKKVSQLEYIVFYWHAYPRYHMGTAMFEHSDKLKGESMAVPSVQDAPFAGRVAFVTGSSRGIGRATVLKLAEKGADVAIHCLNSRNQADEVADLVRQTGQRAFVTVGDVADRSDVDRMVTTVNQELGPIDLLVNNAGAGIEKSFDTLTPEIWDRMIAVNLTGIFNVFWRVKSEMMAQRFGRIVNLTSIAAWAVRPHIMAYAAAKAGVVSLTKSCSEALSPYNIRINAVAPGLISTDVIDHMDQKFQDAIVAQTPQGRIGRPEEIASVIAFLLSEESSFITGTTIIASGGRLAIP